MPLRIGFFSLKSGAGCTALAAHTANFIASGGSYSVALAEKVANGQEPEYRRLKAGFAPDGTCRVNNVHCYPADSGLEPTEDVVVYDFGVINFMFRFPENLHKLYICTTGEAANIPGIIRFKESFDEDQGGSLKFDIVLFGASKEQFNAFKQHPGLSFASTVTMVPDKRVDRLDYNFAMKIQNLFRISGCGLMPPVYDGKAAYPPMSFYTREEYRRIAGNSENTPKGPAPAVVGDDNVGDIGGSCLLSIPEFRPVPEPTEKAKDHTDGISAPGMLGEVIEAVKRSGGGPCSLFIVTKPPERLFVFTDMGVFFDKIGILMRELNASDDIRYAVISHREGGGPEVIGGEDITDPFGRIRLLDADIRTGTEINEGMLKEHVELASFEEVLYPS